VFSAQRWPFEGPVWRLFRRAGARGGPEQLIKTATGQRRRRIRDEAAAARQWRHLVVLGLSVEGFNLGWVVNLHSPDGRAVVQLVTRDATSPIDSVIFVHVGDEVEPAYGGPATWLRDRSSTDFGAVGCAGALSVRQTATSSTLSTTRTKTANSRKPRPQRSSTPGCRPRRSRRACRATY
jgi:hypothetical protein